MRAGIDSIVLPPSASGQAIALYNLLKGIPTSSFFFISPNPYDLKRPTDATRRIEVPYRRVHRAPMQIETLLLQLYQKGWRIPLGLYLKAVSWQIRRILREEKAEALIACSADLLEPYAAYRAARAMKIPFIFYAFDDYVSQWTDPLARLFSADNGPPILHDSDAVVVPNEFLQHDYQERYGIHPYVIHNPIDLSPYQNSRPPRSTRNGDEIRIVYTGAIYEAHYSAFKNLIQALRAIPDMNFRLHLYSEIPKERLIANGIEGPVTFHGPRSLSEIAAIQMDSEILFLPLAFSSDFPDAVMRTASPMKMGEYLAAGVPILVHAPPDSFVSWYFAHYHCGVVVDSDDPIALATALRGLVEDAGLRDRIVASARERARCDYSVDVAQVQLNRIIAFDSEAGRDDVRDSDNTLCI